MTDPDLPPAGQLADQPRGEPPQAHRHPKQNLILASAGVLIVATVVLVLVVTLGGSDGPAPGSPDAVVDDFASALRSHDSTGIGALSCPAQRAVVARPLRGLLNDVQSAGRTGSTHVQGALGVALIGLQTSSKSSGSLTVALRQRATTWCVTSIAISLPVHG